MDDTDGILLNFALSMYIGEKCKYCKKEYKCVAEIKEANPRCTGDKKHKLACNTC